MSETARLADAIERQRRDDATAHDADFAHVATKLARRGVDPESIVARLSKLRIAVPSWALGAGGTRFGRFTQAGEPRDINEKIADVAAIEKLTRANGEISLHIPWDRTDDPKGLRAYLAESGIVCGPINSNTFQDGERPNDSARVLPFRLGQQCVGRSPRARPSITWSASWRWATRWAAKR